METAMINEVRNTFAPVQLATALLNFGVGRFRSFCVKSTIWEERPPLMPQPMTTALIFRRQLVRHKFDLLTASSTADKLSLEKFHRLLDLAFWVKFLKLDSISCFVFLWDVYRVSLNPVVFDLAGLRRTPDAAGGTCHA